MASRVVVEVTVDSVAGAKAAAAAGADRLELAVALGEGGLTPSPGLVAAVLAAVAVPVCVLVRPRAGDFLYDAAELDVMLRDIAALRDAGVAGVVVGALAADGRLDAGAMAAMVAAAGPLSVTCHRAFDLSRDAFEALAILQQLGIGRLLTSGQAASAPAGAALLRRLVERAGTKLSVMAGAGVRPDNVAALVAATGCREVHLSASNFVPSGMQFRRDGVAMGSSAPPSEYTRRITDPAVVAAVVQAVRG